ncbi:HK97 gp10 family phage protein [Ligilactobacillus equi]
MASRVENESSFDAILDRLAQGLSLEDKTIANKAGADIFKNNLKKATPKSDTVYKHGTPHLRDAIVEEVAPTGRVEVGFSAESERGHIARFQNDGWVATDRNGKRHKQVPGKHFWEKAEIESKGKIGEVVKKSLERSIQRKVGR